MQRVSVKVTDCLCLILEAVVVLLLKRGVISRDSCCRSTAVCVRDDTLSLRTGFTAVFVGGTTFTTNKHTSQAR